MPKQKPLNEDDIPEPAIEDLPAREPLGEWQDSAEPEPTDQDVQADLDGDAS
jgi:hypothetical protein